MQLQDDTSRIVLLFSKQLLILITEEEYISPFPPPPSGFEDLSLVYVSYDTKKLNMKG